MRASVLVVLAACSVPTSQFTGVGADAGSSDGAVVAPGMVKVTVVDQTGVNPVPNVPVVFSNPDGTMVAQATSAIDGTAQAEVPGVVSVTAISPVAATYRLVTELGVEPGDAIRLGQVTDDRTPVGTFTVMFPSVPGATGYEVTGPCGGVDVPTSPAVLTITRDCMVPSMEIVVIAIGGAQGMNAFDKNNVPFTDGGSVDLTSSPTPVLAVDASYTNLPVEQTVSSIETSRYVPAQGVGPHSGCQSNDSVSGASLDASLIFCPQTTNALMISLISSATHQGQLIQQAIAGDATHYDVDASASLLPWVARPTLDRTTRAFHVALDPNGTTNDAPDLVEVELQYTHSLNGTPTFFVWQAYMPTAADFVFPALPLADMLPTEADTTQFEFVSLQELSGLTGYAPLRADVVGLFDAAQVSASRMRVSDSPDP